MFSKIKIVDLLFPLLIYWWHFAEKRTVFELYILQDKRSNAKIEITLKIVQIEEKSYFFALFPSGKGQTNQIMDSGAGQLLYTIFCLKIAFERSYL